MEQADLLSAGQEGRPRLCCSKTERLKEETEGDSQTEERRLCPTGSANQDTGEVARFGIEPRLSTDGLYALRRAAALGLGVGLGSAWAMAEDIAQGRLVHVAPRWQAEPLPVALPARPPAALHRDHARTPARRTAQRRDLKGRGAARAAEPCVIESGFVT